MQDSGKPGFRALLEEFGGDVPAAAFVAHRLGTLKPESDVTFEEWEAIWSSTGDSPSLRELALSGLDASGSFRSWRRLWIGLRQKPSGITFEELRDRALERMRELGTFDDAMNLYDSGNPGDSLAVAVLMATKTEDLRRIYDRKEAETEDFVYCEMTSCFLLYERLIDWSDSFAEIDDVLAVIFRLCNHDRLRNASVPIRGEWINLQKLARRALGEMMELGSFEDWRGVWNSCRPNSRYSRDSDPSLPNVQSHAANMMWEKAENADHLQELFTVPVSDQQLERTVSRVIGRMGSAEVLSLLVTTRTDRVQDKIQEEFLRSELDLTACVSFLRTYCQSRHKFSGWFKHIVNAVIDRGTLDEVRGLRRICTDYKCDYREADLLNRLAELYGATDGSGPEGPEPAAAPAEAEDDPPDGTTDDFSVAF